jgi:hypothetical protein
VSCRTPIFWLLSIATLCVSGVAIADDEQTSNQPEWLDLDAQYRVETNLINPLDLNGTSATKTFWTEQRGRFFLGIRDPEVGGVYLRADVLDGVLFGDNGVYGGDPSPNSGLAVATKNPNNTAWRTGLLPGADPLDPASYVPILREVDPIRITHLFGEVKLPIGLMRVGRMPLSEGAGIAAHDGGRRNRWGVSRYNDIADRVLFATKLDEMVNAIRHGASHKADTSQKNGVILAGTYDWNVQDDIGSLADDAYQTNILLSWRREKADWLGLDWRDFQLTAVAVHKGADTFDTDIWAFPIRFTSHIGPLYLNLQLSIIRGETREVSEGLAKLTGKTPKVQAIEHMGAHAMAEYTLGPVALAMEYDYASGDADPRSNTPLTQFSFARDFNVGLLLFEHVLSFQSARSAAVGIENLSQLNATSFPLTEVDSQSRFVNAHAIFPQLKVNIVNNDKHQLHTRLGVLMAWTAAEGVVDPVGTLLQEDGNEISDDAVNFHGGKPGNFYGTEVDVQIGWTYRNVFTWTLEGAMLFPGDALQDENGDAVTSYLVTNRFLFAF